MDYDAVMFVAQAARSFGIEHFMAVTAVGSSKRAAAFYSRVKGEVEEALESLGFDRLDIAQPGLLLGERAQHRPGEAFFQRIAPFAGLLMRGPLQRYGAIQAAAVASALVALADESSPGVYRHENGALTELAKG